MAINDLHQVYPNRNIGLRSAAKQCFEFGQTIAREPSAAHSNGLDEHALARQRQYVEKMGAVVDRLHDRPIPDRPASHPTEMPIDFSVPYIYFTQNLNGNEVPMNEATQELAENWLTMAVELAKSQSAGIAGSLVEYDYTRAVNNLAVISQLIDEIAETPWVDLPETDGPNTTHGPRSSGKSKTAR